MQENLTITAEQREVIDWLLEDPGQGGYRPAELIAAHEENPNMWTERAACIKEIPVKTLAAAVMFPEMVEIEESDEEAIRRRFRSAEVSASSAEANGYETAFFTGYMEAVKETLDALDIFIEGVNV